ncbi:MAG: type 2 lanthipeptide synthetase LanM [Pseudomonadota bacterium]
MGTEPVNWTAIACRAASLDERLSGDFIPAGDEGNLQQAETALRLWIDSAAYGDSEKFDRRLARDGLTQADVVPLLGLVQLRNGGALPDWLATAQDVFHAVMAGGETCPARLADDVPFADLFWPVVEMARARRGDGDLPFLARAAQDDLDAALLRRMAEIYGRTIFDSFSFFRAAGPSPANDAPPGKGLYQAFIAALRTGPFANLIAARPVMIRLLAVIVDQWVAASREFLDRLAKDYPGFGDVFPQLRDAGSITGLTTGISDPHNHGRGVVILAFENGARLVYKPRSVAVEAAWHGLSSWCATHHCPVRLGAAAVWMRGDYGWMQFVTADTALARADAPAFYRDAGGLLAIMHWLRGSDLHHENILLAGGMPVPIDLETLLQPNLRFVETGDIPLRAEQAAQYALDASVLAVGLLPQRKRVAGRLAEVGGLAEAKIETVTTRRFTAINRDDMAWEIGTEDHILAGLAFDIDGSPARIADYADPTIAGFRDTVAFLAAHRDGLFAPDGPMAAFAGVAMRHVLRSTAYYEQLRRESCDPQNQTDGIVWSRHFERLGRNARWDLDDDPGWPLQRAERGALARYDIPLVGGRGDLDGCWADGVVVAPGLLEPAVWPRLRQRLEDLQTHLDWQTAIVRQAVLGGVIPAAAERHDWRDSLNKWDPETSRSVAFDIAEFIAGQATMRGGAAAWIGADAGEDGETLETRLMADDLYGGTTGIALFLAACFRTGGGDKFRDLARAALCALRYRLAHGLPDRRGAIMPVGGYAGWGGVVYALTRCAQWLDAPDLYDDARRAAARIDTRSLAADRMYDVIGGAAGAAMGLLALYRATGDAAILERAVACGRHIPPVPEGCGDDGRNWRGVSARPLAGFSHGAAGISHALLALYDACGDPAFLETARRGLDFERTLFDPARGNWPDLRNAEKTGYPVQWCHGAAGIGMARIASLPVLDTPAIRADIVAAIGATVSVRDGGRDNLCCGHAGRFSMLGYAARALGDSELMVLTQSRMAEWLARAGGNGLSGFHLMGTDTVLRTGLMQGLPGVGYALLEQTDPDLVPPVLLLR